MSSQGVNEGLNILSLGGPQKVFKGGHGEEKIENHCAKSYRFPLSPASIS